MWTRHGGDGGGCAGDGGLDGVVYLFSAANARDYPISDGANASEAADSSDDEEYVVPFALLP